MHIKHSIRIVAATALAGALLAPAAASAASATYVPYASSWRVLDNGTDQTPGFAASSYVETAAWRTETVQANKVLGYGDNGRANLPTQTPNLSFGASSSNKYITTYFRQTFTVPDASQLSSLMLNLIRDDAAVIYINGVEVARSNMPAGPITYLTFSSTIVDSAAEYTPNAINIPTTAVVSGQNLLAIELHQRDGTSSDISFSAQLVGTTVDTVVPEAPIAILLPLLGLATLGGGVYIQRRRTAAN